MDFLKRQLADYQEQFEVKLTPVSITLVPPPAVAVHVFLRLTRENKNLFTSRKYLLEPGQNGTRKKI
jgi:hypothetical protein